jgi:hypothetical protein
MGAVAVAVAGLLSLREHELAIDAMRVEQLMEPLELLVPLYIKLECLVDSIYTALGTVTATATATALLLQ